MSGLSLASSMTASSKTGCLCTAHGVFTGAQSLSTAAERLWEIILSSKVRARSLLMLLL